MSLWQIEEINKISNRKINKDLIITDISINSRDLKKNSLFFAIKGEKFDGHDFVYDAFKNGASAAVVEKEKLGLYKDSFFSNKVLFTVDDSLLSLQKLAHIARERTKNLKMICITGSSGKTSVKNWLSKILLNKNVHYTKGNLNNHIGLPLTLTKMKKNSKFCVLEVGMSQPNEIQKLTEIAKPHFSILTNVGPAHIGNFESINDIAREKCEIFFKDCFAIYPKDSIYFNIIDKLAKKKASRTFTFGYSEMSDFQITKIKKFDSLKKIVSFRLINERIDLKLVNYGNHWLSNILIILAISKLLKISIQEITNNILNLKPNEGRGSIHKLLFNNKKIILFDDSYNSNPISLKASLDTVKILPPKKMRKICVIGDMLELGKNSKLYHRKVVSLIRESNVNVVLTIGYYSKVIFENLPQSIESFHFDDLDMLYDKLKYILKDNDFLMIKGSNSMNLNIICNKLKFSS